jgi:hypothetical protein
MKKKKTVKKSEERPIFDSVRKPLPPPSRTIGKAKPDEKARPARRKAKHKNPPDGE